MTLRVCVVADPRPVVPHPHGVIARWHVIGPPCPRDFPDGSWTKRRLYIIRSCTSCLLLPYHYHLNTPAIRPFTLC